MFGGDCMESGNGNERIRVELLGNFELSKRIITSSRRYWHRRWKGGFLLHIELAQAQDLEKE